MPRLVSRIEDNRNSAREEKKGEIIKMYAELLALGKRLKKLIMTFGVFIQLDPGRGGEAIKWVKKK